MDIKRNILAAGFVALMLIASWYTHAELRAEISLAPAPEYPGEESWREQLTTAILNASTVASASGFPVIANAPEVVGTFTEGLIFSERPRLMAHDSSIVPLEGGRMAASWYSGSREGAQDVSVYFSTLSDGQWSQPIPIVTRDIHMKELGRYAKKVGNAMLARDEEGRLWLFYCSIPMGGWSWSTLNYKYSEDEGMTWSKARQLVLSPFFNLTNNVKNKALAISGGGFMLPTYHELVNKRSELVRLMPGGSYDKVRMTRMGKAIQPSLVPKGGGRLGAFYRNMASHTEGQRQVLYSESPDMGRTWGQIFEASLSNPNAGLDVISESGQGGNLLAVLNNLQKDRHRLTLERSHDGGHTWQEVSVLEDNEGMEFSYPFIARATDGTYHVTYTYDRRSIKHLSFDQLWLEYATSAAEGGL